MNLFSSSFEKHNKYISENMINGKKKLELYKIVDNNVFFFAEMYNNVKLQVDSK